MALGGAERVVSSLAHGLSDRGHDVAVSGAAGPLDAELGRDIRRLVLPERGRSPLGVMEWTALEAVFIRAFRPHVVHAHNTKATVIAAAAGRLARGPRRPPVLATHHGAAQDDRERAARLLERAADEVVCVSEDLLPAFSGAVQVIHNGVAAALPSERGVGGDPTVVAFVGRLVDVKNPERFLRAAALVGGGARFVVVGDGALRPSLEALARQLGVDVTFTGAVPDARRDIANADLMVVSSDSEGQSIATLEALAAGTPVVSTPVSGMAGLLTEPGAGIVAPDFTPEALAAAITELVGDPVRRRGMGAAGAKLVLERFSADVMVDAYERRYRLLAPTITS
jgi:glycosyltransferase involved in cell wall biosynthesis